MKKECELKIKIIPLSSALGKDELVRLSRMHDFHVFDLDSVKNELQVKLAFFHAEKAFEERRNISKDTPLEIMARLAATRQIAEAIAKAGIKNPSRIIAAYKAGTPGIDETKLKKMLKARRIPWKQTDAEKEIRKMVETEIEE